MPMSGTVENMKLAELTTDELDAADLDVVSAGGASMSYNEVEFRYTRRSLIALRPPNEATANGASAWKRAQRAVSPIGTRRARPSL
jgi:hypothetical protein